MVASLSEYEMSIALDARLILTKNIIIQKVYELFGEILLEYENVLKGSKLSAAFEADGKISRGENYKGLPYVVLDYPRQFGKRDVFAIRTFFWWGNFFSITLQIAGLYQQVYAPLIEEAMRLNECEGWYIGQGEDPWQHHFEEDNYAPIESSKDYHLAALPFIKMAKKIPLKEWDIADVFFKDSFSFLIKILNA